MPAYFDSGFCVRQPSWHGEETLLADYPGSWAEARKLAGLDWEPIELPVYELVGVDDDGREIFAPIPDWKKITRSDNHKTLSIRSDTYEIIDHTAMGEIVEAVLEQPNVKWETAGSLEEGRSVWCLALLDEPIKLPGDKSLTLPYLAITNRHDGSGACALRSIATRIVCANTFRAAELEGERNGTTYSFVHRGSWRNRVVEAREAVTGARREIAQYVKLAEDLLAIKVTPVQRELFVTEFFPMPPQNLISDRVVRNVEDARTALRQIMASRTTEEVAGSVYGLVQGAGEYLDHIRRSRSWETRLNRTLLRPEPLKARALKLARAVAAN